MKPLFSVIVPVYNVAPYLMACLDSLCAAVAKLRHVSERTVEIICIDDGSTDGSGAILDRYSVDKGYVKAVHQYNKGLGPARNVGIDMATGEWLLFVDSDDEVSQDYLTLIADIANQQMPDVIKFNHVDVWKLGGTYDSGGGTVRYIGADTDPKAFFNVLNSAFAWNICYRRESIASIRFANITPGEDVLFSCVMLNRVNSVVVTSAPIYHYLQRTDSLAHKKVISIRQVESCGISTLQRVISIMAWRHFKIVSYELYKMVRNTYIGHVGLMLSRVVKENRKIAWQIYCEYGKQLFANGAEYIPCVIRYIGYCVFKCESRMLWDIFLFWPWLTRVWLLKLRNKFCAL